VKEKMKLRALIVGYGYMGEIRHQTSQQMAGVEVVGVVDPVRVGQKAFSLTIEKDFLKAHKPDAIVYFTDGFGQGPDKRPKVPVLWALIGSDAQKPVQWGKIISLNQDIASID